MRPAAAAPDFGRMLSSRPGEAWKYVSVMRKRGDSYIIHIMTRLRIILFFCVLLLPPAKTAHAAELVMAEQAACGWCEAWDEEIGGIYHKTPEGRIAPLRRVAIHEPLPADLAFIEGLVYTPTFVLVEGGREIGRINGYAGQDFFWGLLRELLEKLPDASAGRSPGAAHERTGKMSDMVSTKG